MGAKRVNITDEQTKEILRLFHEEGFGAPRIAAKMQISASAITKLLKKLGLKQKTGSAKRDVSELLRKKIIMLFENGSGLLSISKQLNIGIGIIKRVCNELGLQREKPYTQFSDVQLDQIRALFERGAGAERIGEKMGVGRMVMRRVLDEMGLKRAQNLPVIIFEEERRCRVCWLLLPVEQFDGTICTCKNCLSNEKVCTRCHLSKPREEFRTARTYCKECGRIEAREYWRNHKEEKAAYDKIQKPAYFQKNKAVIMAKHNEWAKLRERRDPGFKIRRRISYMIYMGLRNGGGDKNFESSWDYLPYTLQELIEWLESLFEPWMNWSNYGGYNARTWNDKDQATWKWSIDHIIPQSFLPYSLMTEENFTKVWALKNLRPYSAKQNILDGNRR